MSSWNVHLVGISLSKQQSSLEQLDQMEQMEQLVYQFMECLGLQEYDLPYGECCLDHKSQFFKFNEYDRNIWSWELNYQCPGRETLFVLLNIIFGNTVVGFVDEDGNSVADLTCYEELVLDPDTMHVWDYYRKGSFNSKGVYLTPKHIRVPANSDYIMKLKERIIKNAAEEGYTALTAMVLEKLQEDRINDFLAKMKKAGITEQEMRKWLW